MSRSTSCRFLPSSKKRASSFVVVIFSSSRERAWAATAAAPLVARIRRLVPGRQFPIHPVTRQRRPHVWGRPRARGYTSVLARGRPPHLVGGTQTLTPAASPAITGALQERAFPPPGRLNVALRPGESGRREPGYRPAARAERPGRRLHLRL